MKKISRTIVVGAVAALALASFAGPAGAHRGKDKGKKAMGMIASFDGTTLTVTTPAGETVTGTFTEETRVKVDHRGHHDRSGNPTRGDVDDLTAGAFVLRMKIEEDGTLDKIWVRAAQSESHEFEPKPETPETPEPAETPEPVETPEPLPTETPDPLPTETPDPVETTTTELPTAS